MGISIKALKGIGKIVQKKNITGKETNLEKLQKNDYGKRHKTKTSEIACLILRPHFNLFSVPYILN